MRTAKEKKVEQYTDQSRVDLVLKLRQGQGQGEDILLVSHLAEEVKAEAHISVGAWQVLVGVPERSRESAICALQETGGECFDYVDGPVDERTAFVMEALVTAFKY